MDSSGDESGDVRPPKVTFSIVHDDDEDEKEFSPDEEIPGDEDEEEYQNGSPSNSSWRLPVPTAFLQLRRISDHGLKHAREQIRRFSNTSSKLLKISNLARLTNIYNGAVSEGRGNHHGHNHVHPRGRPRAGAPRRMSVAGEGILKKSHTDQEAQNHDHCHHGLNRKSVSFCLRDSVMVYQLSESDAESLASRSIGEQHI